MEEAWELAVVSAVGNLLELITQIEQAAASHPNKNVPSLLSDIASEQDDTLMAFVGKFHKSIDAAVDEVMSSPNIPYETKPVMASRLSQFRGLVSVGFSQPNIRSAVQQVLRNGAKDNLLMIYSASVAGGTKPLFSKVNAKEIREEVIELMQKLNDFDIDRSIQQAMITSLDEIAKILGEYEIYGPRDAELRIKALASDANALRASMQEAEVSDELKDEVELGVLQPLFKLARKAYPSVKVSNQLYLAGGAVKALIESAS